MISCIITAISFSIIAHYCDNSAIIATILEVLKSNKTAHKILIADQKFKKISK